ncbi:PH domain-containing protein [Streptomyces sp. NPDC002644]
MNGSGDSAGWRRLDPRIVVATAVWCALLGVVALAVLWWRDAPWWLYAAVPAAALWLPAYEGIRWHRTTYRLTSERVELRTGVAVRSHRSVPRQRVRSVDVSANPVHRILGIRTVRIGTGHRVGSGQDAVLTLDALAVRDSDTLGERLLRGRGAGEDGGDSATLARIRWSWLRFAPLSVVPLLLGLSAVGGLYNLLDLLGAEPDTVLVPRLISWLTGSADLLTVVPLAVLAVLTAGVVGALGLYVEMWWDFRLTREPNGTLRAARGLVVTRSVSLEEERLRGVEIAEPLLLRRGGGAYTYAVATGAGTVEEELRVHNTGALLPPAPLAEAHRVAAAVLGEDRDPTESVRLLPHTRLALHRMLRLVLLAGLGVGGVLVLLGVLLTPVLVHAGWITALVVWAAGAPFAVDAHRNLGHGVTGRYLVTRHGTLKRRTVALRRDGVIGWNITQWAWHRRSRLSRLTATTAGGRGAYHVKDVLLPEGLRFADEAVPGLLEPFLVRAPVVPDARATRRLGPHPHSEGAP